MNKSHSKYHSENAFCGSAGTEEMDHLRSLIEELSDDELKLLVNNLEIYFEGEVNRENYELVIDEVDREGFYREYKKIISSRK